MKRFNLTFAFLMALFFLLVVFPSVNAQTTTDRVAIEERTDGVLIKWNSVSLDSAEVAYSNEIDLSNYDDNSWATTTWGFGYKAASSDSINIILSAWYSYDNTNYFSAGAIDTITTATATAGTANLGNKKAPFWKLKAENISNVTNSFSYQQYYPLVDK